MNAEKRHKAVELKKRKPGQKLLFFNMILYISIVSISLFSCSGSLKDPLFYKERAFSARVSVASARLNFDAIFHISVKDNSFTAELISPKSLDGLTIVQSGDEMKISLGEKEFLSDRSVILRDLSIGKIAYMLAPVGTVRSIKSVGGLTAVSVENVTVYIDPKSSMPVKAEDNNGLSVTVSEFWFS